MAIVKSAAEDNPSIKTNASVYYAIRYVTNIKKGEHTSTFNCTYNSNEDISRLVNEFEAIRNISKNHRKDNIFAHHYIQSFKPDEITPEKAHEIGRQLIERLGFAENFQMIFSTHEDRDHIHNHFLFNAVGLNGIRWYDNKNTVQIWRNKSDELCRENGLSVIEEHSGKKSVDSVSYQLGKRGKSWKFELVRLLDDAFEKMKDSKSKAEFIDFFNKNNFSVKWKNKNITFTKNGEAKGIRADTLAKTFGAKYSKENIEKALGIYDPKYDEKMLADYYEKNAAKDWRAFEKWFFKNLSETARAELVAETETTITNVNFQRLLNSNGENLTINIPIENLEHLSFEKMFFYAVKDNEKKEAAVTVKKYNAPKVKRWKMELLNQVDEILGEDFLGKTEKEKKAQQLEKHRNAKLNKQIKEEAEGLGHRPCYKVITHNDLEKLKYTGAEFSYFIRGDGRYNLIFLEREREKIETELYNKTNTQYQ